MPDTNLDDALLAIRQGQAAGQALGYAAEHLEQLAAAVDTSIFTKLQAAHVLTPDEAIQAWFEKYAYYRLARKLQQTVRIGKTTAERIAPALDLNKEP